MGNPAIQSLRKARRDFAKTPYGQLQALWKERSKWLRRETIARNKLTEIEDRIDALAFEVCNPPKQAKPHDPYACSP